MGPDSPHQVSIGGCRPPRAGLMAALVGSGIVANIACGARTGLDLDVSTVLDSGSVGALRDGDLALDAMTSTDESSDGTNPPPCSSYKTLRACLNNRCNACIGAVAMTSQKFVCYEGDYGCIDGPDGEVLFQQP
jgi:hypothetical protein